MIVSLSSFQIYPAANAGYDPDNLEVRWWYNRGYIDSSTVFVQGGNGQSGFYITSPCTVDGDGIISVPSTDLFSTLDAADPNPQSIQIFGRLYSNNTAKQYVTAYSSTPTGWVVQNSSPLTYEDLVLENQSIVLANPSPTFPTFAQMIAYINSLTPTPLASDVVIGRSRFRTAPTDALDPIAVEDNDPRVNAVYNIKTYGAVGDGNSSLSSAPWRAQFGIPSSVPNAYLGGTTFGTLTFVDGVDTKDYVAMAYAVYLSGQNRGTYVPGSGVTLVESIEIIIPPGTYNLNKLIGLYSSYYVTATNAVLVRSGAGPIFNILDPIKTVISGIQFQGGTNAILVANENIDATELDVTRNTFQGQTDYAVRGSSTATAMPKALRVVDNKFINTAGGVYNTSNQAIIESNWFEMTTTNPLLYNDGGQASFSKNRITAGAASPPADWIINAGQLRAEWNIIGGESPAGKRFLRVIAGAQYTSVQHNIVHSDTDSYNIQLDVYPINVFIEHNWFQSNNGFIVNDNYVGATAGATASIGAALGTSNNTFKHNQQGNSATPVLPFIAFKNGGLYFTFAGTGLGRTATTREVEVVWPGTDFTNLFPDASEGISGSWTASGVSFSNNAVVAPDGSTTGSNIAGNAFGTLDSTNITTVALGGAGAYTLSLYVRNYAAANIVSVYNVTDSVVVVARPLSVGTEWIREIISFYAATGKTYIVRFNLVTGGSLNAWGFQINPGYHAAPYLYRGTSAKSSAFPFVGPERPVYYSAAMPSTGDWKAGMTVFATAPTEQGTALSKYILLGWRRITTGSGNVLNTDWLEMRTLTGN